MIYRLKGVPCSDSSYTINVRTAAQLPTKSYTLESTIDSADFRFQGFYANTVVKITGQKLAITFLDQYTITIPNGYFTMEHTTTAVLDYSYTNLISTSRTQSLFLSGGSFVNLNLEKGENDKQVNIYCLG